MNDERFDTAVSRIDAANSADPHLEVHEGSSLPAALLYAQRMSECLNRIAPDASDALKLAVRAQHLMRWQIPRQDFPEGRKGYLEWRTRLARFHAEEAAKILRECGYDDAFVTRVQVLVRKERFRQDAEAQTLEDVACLVFLEHYLLDFGEKHTPEKVAEILRKTWRKMSPDGQREVAALDLPERLKALVAAAG